MKKITVILTALALALCLGAGMGTAWAYFTTYVTAKGSYRITLGSETDIEEKVESKQKSIQITNKEGSAVFVRVRAYAGEDLELTYSDPSGKWYKPAGDEWYYYNGIVGGGQTTEELVASFELPPLKEGEHYEDGDNFNIVVVYECTRRKPE